MAFDLGKHDTVKLGYEKGCENWHGLKGASSQENLSTNFI